MNILIQQVMLQKEEYDTKCKAGAGANSARSLARSSDHTPTKRLQKTRQKILEKIPQKRKVIENPTETTPIPKKPKIDDSGSCFGYFEPQPLPNHHVPAEIFKIETKEDCSYLPTIHSMIDDSKSDRFRYTQAYKALLYLEEAAEKVSMKKYDRTNIQLSNSNSQRIFTIQNDVCHFMTSLSVNCIFHIINFFSI